MNETRYDAKSQFWRRRYVVSPTKNTWKQRLLALGRERRFKPLPHILMLAEERSMVEMPCCDCRACKAVGACNETKKCCQHPRVPMSELDLIAFRSGLYSQSDIKAKQ